MLRATCICCKCHDSRGCADDAVTQVAAECAAELSVRQVVAAAAGHGDVVRLAALRCQSTLQQGVVSYDRSAIPSVRRSVSCRRHSSDR